jgi:putative RNA 2'-phosphotransferase
VKATQDKSKRLSLWLRHWPDAIGISLDPQWWTSINELLTKAATAGFP